MTEPDDPDEYEIEVPCGLTIIGEQDALEHEADCGACLHERSQW